MHWIKPPYHLHIHIWIPVAPRILHIFSHRRHIFDTACILHILSHCYHIFDIARVLHIFSHGCLVVWSRQETLTLSAALTLILTAAGMVFVHDKRAGFCASFFCPIASTRKKKCRAVQCVEIRDRRRAVAKFPNGERDGFGRMHLVQSNLISGCCSWKNFLACQ